MQTIVLWGGALGFALAGAAGLAADRPIDLVVRDATIGCLAGAWLLRWWWSQVERALSEAVEIRRRQAADAREAEAAAKEKPSSATPARNGSRTPVDNPALDRAKSAPLPASRL